MENKMIDVAERERRIVLDELNELDLFPRGTAKHAALFRDIFTFLGPLEDLVERSPSAVSRCRLWSYELWILAMFYRALKNAKVGVGGARRISH